MANIYIIDTLRLKRRGLEVKDSTNKWTAIHFQQGGLDGACVVYSTIMALLCRHYISEEDIDTFHHPDRRTNKGKLISLLLDEQGLVRDGYTFTRLAREINDICSDLSAKRIKGGEEITSIIGEYTDQDNPVIISVSGNGWCHAMLAIGTEYDDNDRRYKILCLDPGQPLNKGSYWNCVVDVSRCNSGDYPFWYIPTDSSIAADKVSIDEIITIDTI